MDGVVVGGWSITPKGRGHATSFLLESLGAQQAVELGS